MTDDLISREAVLECLDWKYPDKLPKTKIMELPSMDNIINKTNYQMVKSYDHNPENWGLLNEDEIKKIEQHFQIKERNDIELQNLRDFVAMYYQEEEHELLMDNKHTEYLRKVDTLSAITGVIDQEKIKRGIEI